MNTDALEQAILDTMDAEGDQKLASHAYFTFLKSQLHLPVEQSDQEDAEPRVLFLEQNEAIFLPVFSQIDYLTQWAGEEIEKIDRFTLSGVELLKGLGENVTIALNPGFPSYKEFNPEEVNKLKTMVMKIQSLVQD